MNRKLKMAGVFSPSSSRGVLLLPAMILVSGCAGDDSGRELRVDHGEGSETGEFAVTIYASGSGAERRIQFRPIRGMSMAADERVQYPTGEPIPGSQEDGEEVTLGPTAVVETPSGSKEIQQTELGESSSWGLLEGAIWECDADRVVVPPWDQTRHAEMFVFTAWPAHCGDVRRYQEVLVCAADKLQQVAEASSELVWTGTTHMEDPLRGPWRIPPQRAVDRFIARDLAIYVLAHVAWLDMVKYDDPTDSDPNTWTTCTDLLGAAATQAGATKWATLGDTSVLGCLWGGTCGPRKETVNDVATLKRFAVDTLHLRTFSLRQAGRMLKSLIEESVQADLAGAEQRRARAGDRLEGSRKYWGVAGGADSGAGDAPYNSVEHAMRVLSGRWELGPFGYAGLGGPDPQCSSAGSLELVSKAYGNDLSARYAARSVTTAAQERAIALVEAAGIVVPVSAIDGASFAAVREKILEQMLHREAVRLGIPGDDAEFRAVGKGKVLAAEFARVTDADLRFALKQALDTYRLATGAAEDVTNLRGSATQSAWAPEAETTEHFRTSGWAVFASGLPRMDVTADIMARAGGIQQSSQCDSKQGANGYLSPEANYGGVRMAFQDSFSLAQSLHRRLVRVRQRLSTAGASAELETASAATAELAEWMGPGRIVASAVSWANPAAAKLRLYTIGFTPEDWAVQSGSQMAGELVLVYGESWMADCVARLRNACPSAAELEAATIHPSAATVWAPPGRQLDPQYQAKQRAYAFDGTFGQFDFPRDPMLMDLQPSGEPATGSNPKRLYAVQLHDPEAPGTRGKVLGAIALRKSGGATQLVVSDLQRKLMNDVLGIDKQFGTSAPRLAGPDPSLGKSYCILEAPRNMFVPLENELTSDSDGYESSWKHYLQLARQAATRADELGQKLIDLGLQQDYRREAAQEELAGVCGGYGALDDVVISNGSVMPASTSKDEGLNNCLQEGKKDVVFLTEDQALGQTGKTPGAFLREDVLRCSDYPNPICAQEEITSAGLNLVKARNTPPAANTCQSVLALVKTLPTGFDGAALSQVGVAPWLQTDSVAALVQSLRIESVEPSESADWVVYFGGEIIMDSRQDQSGSSGPPEQDAGAGGAGPTSALRWPGCLRTQQSCDWDNASISLFNDLYRDGQKTALGTVAERMVLRWRVEGSMWTLASLSGRIPAGMFSTRIPAANFAVITPEPSSGIAPTTAHALTVYGGSVIEYDPTTQGYFLAQESSMDSALLGAGEPIPITHTYGWSEEVPEWLRKVYDDNIGVHGAYYSFPATNDEVDLGAKADFSVSETLAKIGSGLNSFACTGPEAYHGYGAAGGNLLDGVEAAKVLAEVKGLRYKPSGKTRLQLSRPAEVGPGLWIESSVLPDVEVHLADTGTGDNDCIHPDCAEPKKVIPFYPWGNDPSFYGLPEKLMMTEYGKLQALFRLDALHSTDVLDTGTGNSTQWQYRWTRRMLTPKASKPSQRVPAFVNSYAPPGACGAAAQIAQAVALACTLSSGDLLPPPVAPPSIRSIEDLPYFTRWIEYQANRASLVASRLYLEKVPERVIADLSAGRVGSGDSSGEHGRTVIQMGTSLRGVVDGWAKVEADLRMLMLAMESAQNQIAAADIRHNEKLKEYAIRKLQMQVTIAQAIAGAVAASSPTVSGGTSGLSMSFNPVGAIAQITAAATTVSACGAQAAAVDDLEALAGEEKANQIVQVFINLQQTAEPIYQDLQASLLTIQDSVGSYQQLSSQLRQSEAAARYQAAKGLGADYAVIDDHVVEFPVNTVLRREYDITRRRYEAALKDAKYLAYVARLAIEQRIGMRLGTIDTSVGALEAPSLWADDVCNLQGIDYQKLRSYLEDKDAGADVTAPSEAAEAATIAEFADQYIGDYVTKLENFVEYFNIQYPSHDGDDTSILSLRDDLLAGAQSCIATSPNLLLYSGDMTGHDSIAEGDSSVTRGWQLNACDGADRCLRLIDGNGLPAPGAEPLNSNQPPAAHVGGGVTWLLETPAAYGPESDAGITNPPIEIEAGAGPSAPQPARTVWQTLRLEPGTYILSWWDQARDPSGQLQPPLVGSSPSTLQVGLYREDWQVLDVRPFTPHVVACVGQQGCDAAWSATPQSMSVQVAQSGVYHVGFTASRSNEPAASVAIANVQLELAQAPGASPSAYVGTGASRVYVSGACPRRTDSDVQAAFTYRCEAEAGCFYELQQPILLDTGTDASTSSTNGKFAKGNFNFRHITAAVNLVGTGLRDCSGSGTSSCYGSGFIEYSLVHDAFDVGVLGWDNRVQRFNFGSANINHAKALAAERFITLPLSSADQALLAQPGIEKQELTGRPIDGSYRLRIWDTPGLTWNRLEDVQIVLKYRYWSAIQKQPGSP